ncbi:MAG: hypothetical protein AAFX99_16095 [Myxococcota bacterium]
MFDDDVRIRAQNGDQDAAQAWFNAARRAGDRDGEVHALAMLGLRLEFGLNNIHAHDEPEEAIP